MLVYRSAIDLSSSALRLLARHLAARRIQLRTRWRRLSTGRQALLALAHLRCGDTYTRLAAAFQVGVATAHRYVAEAIDVLETSFGRTHHQQLAHLTTLLCVGG